MTWKTCAHAARAASEVPPFRLRLGCVGHVGSPDEWVFIEVHEVDGSWAHLRHLIARPERVIEQVSPHVTIVHPRSANRGCAAWKAIRRRTCRMDVVVRQLAVTAFDGRWVTAEWFPLGRRASDAHA